MIQEEIAFMRSVDLAVLSAFSKLPLICLLRCLTSLQFLSMFLLLLFVCLFVCFWFLVCFCLFLFLYFVLFCFDDFQKSDVTVYKSLICVSLHRCKQNIFLGSKTIQ